MRASYTTVLLHRRPGPVLRPIEFHFVPKHASWLDMVAIEIAVLRTQYLDRRIDERAELELEIAHRERRRNASGTKICWMKIRWMFNCEKAPCLRETRTRGSRHQAGCLNRTTSLANDSP
jgi:hypothetical protein